MSKKSKHRFANLGYPSILLTFTMISIVTFSVLAFMTANSDYRLSKTVAQNNTNYYKAEQKAYTTLAVIDQQLQQVYFSAHTEKDFYRKSRSSLSKLNFDHTILELSTTNYKDLNCHFSEVISDTQTLDISICISYPQSDTIPFFSITQWQTVTHENFEEDHCLNSLGTN